MKKLLSLVILLLTCATAVMAQPKKVDSLTTAYQKNKQDTTLVLLLVQKSNWVYLNTKPDSGMISSQKALALARKIHYKRGEVEALISISAYLARGGDLPGSLRINFDALPKAIQINDPAIIMYCYNNLGLDYGILKDHKKSLYYISKFKATAEKIHSVYWIMIAYNNISKAFLDDNNPDSALYYTQKAYDLSVKEHRTGDDVFAFLWRNFGIIKLEKGNYTAAIVYFKKSIETGAANGNHYILSESYRKIAETYRKINQTDSGIYYAKKAYEEAKADRSTDLILESTGLLTALLRSVNNYKEAFDYQQIMLNAKETLFSQQKALQIQNLMFGEQQRRQEAETARIAYQDKVRLTALLSALGVLLLTAAMLFYNNARKKKANTMLHRQNEQIETQKNALEKTLAELQSTQTQLIQSEKMASLGELTAGIAHEIQNPLNFVNNFSEVNKEMLEELESEIKNGNTEDALILTADIKQNHEKINHHGKRADFIVKGMLQHSRTNTGEKQSTNLNVLCDEFLKLSYHGLRAKDNSFNAEMITNFDPELPRINVSQQDMGRVMLNLFNNAFYAVNQKTKTADENYKPTVEVETFFLPLQGVGGFKVKDNGVGIPDNIKEKIMQPFFTTKPTGEGTGLGLSLTYDMVVKGHGGKIDVNTKEGDFTEFIISLPLNG